MAELETKDAARQALERAIELCAAAEVPDQVLDAIGRFLLAHSHGRPNEARVRISYNGYQLLADKVIDLNGTTMLNAQLDTTGQFVQVEVSPERR